MDNSQRIHIFISIITISLVTVTGFLFQQIFGQTNQTLTTSDEEIFRSQFDTFVSADPEGYGMFEEKESNIFSPGETLWLYVEPVGYSYGNATDENGDQLYTMNFTADVTISTPDGTIISGQEDVPLSTLISHHQNKEVMLVMSVDQNPPFTPGDYVMGYTFTDENSGEDFDIKKGITVQ